MAMLWMDSKSWYDDDDIVLKHNQSNTSDTIETADLNEMQYYEDMNQQLAGANIVNFSSGEIHTGPVIVSTAYYFPLANPKGYGCLFYIDSADQCGIRAQPDGSFEAFRGDQFGSVGTSRTGLFRPGCWNTFEYQMKAADSPNGWFKVRINGELVFSGEGLDTQRRTTAGFDRFAIRGEGALVGHMCILDDAGSYNNDFLGPIWVRALPPITSGEHQDWLPSGETTNLDCVKDSGLSPPDINLNTYVGSVTDGEIDTYKFEYVDNIPGSTIRALSMNYVADHNNDPVHPDAPGCSTAAVYHTETEFEISGEYVNAPWRAKTEANMFHGIWDRNPSGEIEWTPEAIDSGEFGFKLNTGQL